MHADHHHNRRARPTKQATACACRVGPAYSQGLRSHVTKQNDRRGRDCRAKPQLPRGHELGPSHCEGPWSSGRNAGAPAHTPTLRRPGLAFRADTLELSGGTPPLQPACLPSAQPSGRPRTTGPSAGGARWAVPAFPTSHSALGWAFLRHPQHPTRHPSPRGTGGRPDRGRRRRASVAAAL